MANDLVKVGCAVLDDYEKWLLEKTDAFVKECAERTSAQAGNLFEQAYYAGENDVRTGFDITGDKEAQVYATGDATLFIEFGTGVNNPTTAAERKERAEVSPGMLAHGEYGLKKASNPKGWVYSGEPGTSQHASVVRYDEGTALATRTIGDSAASPMYTSKELLNKKFKGIVKEVYRK